MKLKLIIFLFSNIFFIFSFGQTNENKDTYEIVSVVIVSINSEIPVVDTLAPAKFSSKFLRKQIEEKVSLNRKQKKILRKGDKTKFGILINRTELPMLKFYDNDSIVNAYKNLNKKSLEYIFKKKPFYIISKPIIFEESGIAILDVNLIGGYGAIYILRRENGKWNIIGEVGKWYV
jgi:hypothetical protein